LENAPAVASCYIVLQKPALKTPMGITLQKDFNGQLHPPGVMNGVQGYCREAGEALASSERIAKKAFTGTTPLGSHIIKPVSYKQKTQPT
ncbi:aldehyde dehydrogenase family protein, partial [Pseudomonas sp. RTB2]|uniref:aldehyde dehydrogenase family protein n=1 Tax=Pseudomonas sp. RTB2 TaxID=3048632 RepID=UPI002B229A6D